MACDSLLVANRRMEEVARRTTHEPRCSLSARSRTRFPSAQFCEVANPATALLFHIFSKRAVSVVSHWVLIPPPSSGAIAIHIQVCEISRKFQLVSNIHSKTPIIFHIDLTATVYIGLAANNQETIAFSCRSIYCEAKKIL